MTGMYPCLCITPKLRNVRCTRSMSRMMPIVMKNRKYEEANYPVTNST